MEEEWKPNFILDISNNGFSFCDCYHCDFSDFAIPLNQRSLGYTKFFGGVNVGEEFIGCELAA